MSVSNTQSSFHLIFRLNKIVWAYGRRVRSIAFKFNHYFNHTTNRYIIIVWVVFCVETHWAICTYKVYIVQSISSKSSYSQCVVNVYQTNENSEKSSSTLVISNCENDSNKNKNRQRLNWTCINLVWHWNSD